MRRYSPPAESITEMRTSDLDYELPQELIAQTPIEPRDASRLMVVWRDEGRIEHRLFGELIEYLRPGDVLVCNESRVIPARLRAHKIPTGGKVELLLLTQREEGLWEALSKGRRVPIGCRLLIDQKATGEAERGREATIYGEIVGRTQGGKKLIRFSQPIKPHLSELGVVPLPPYIHRPLADAERYQTVYSRTEGSVAAPTAGLHFTPEYIERVRGHGVEFAFLTLHINWDTFRPVREESLEEHQMYSEYCELSSPVSDQLNRAIKEGRRIMAVGTTSVRVLETAAQEGAPRLRPYRGWASLFIYPGYHFRAVDALLTNFHLPRSTLLALVYAFAGKGLIDTAYREAIRLKYRFYSFGDCMLIL